MKSRVIQAFLVPAGVCSMFLLALANAGTVNSTEVQHAALVDTHIVVGGNTDCTSQLFLAVKQSQSDFDPNANYVPVQYGDCAGDFAPWLGGATPQAAIADGVNQ